MLILIDFFQGETLWHIQCIFVCSDARRCGSTRFKCFLLGVVERLTSWMSLNYTMWQILLQQLSRWPLGEVFDSILAALCQSTLHRCSIYFNVNGRRAAAFSLVRGRWIFRSFGKSQPTCTTPKVMQNVRLYLGKLKITFLRLPSLNKTPLGTRQKVGHSRLGQGEFWSSHLPGVNEVDALGWRLWLWQFHFCPKTFVHFA